MLNILSSNINFDNDFNLSKHKLTYIMFIIMYLTHNCYKICCLLLLDTYTKLIQLEGWYININIFITISIYIILIVMYDTKLIEQLFDFSFVNLFSYTYEFWSIFISKSMCLMSLIIHLINIYYKLYDLLGIICRMYIPSLIFVQIY